MESIILLFYSSKKINETLNREHEQPPAWHPLTHSPTHPSHGFVTF